MSEKRNNKKEKLMRRCPVCFWQYDVVAHEHPDIAIGPNRVSLNTAKENYRLIKACEERLIQFVRPPREDEI